MQIIVTDVRAGPAGLVVVKLNIEGQRRQLIMPKKLAGVAQIEWAAGAAATLVEIGTVPS